MQSDNIVGIIGLGNMGGAMARNLLDEGWTIVGYDRDEEVLSSMVEYGLMMGDSPVDIADRADIIITSLPTPEAVETVYLSDNGIKKSKEKQFVALEMSTISPHTIKKIDNLLDIDLLDAPVSGGPEKALDGSLTLMVGGERRVYNQNLIQTIIASLSDDVYYLGDLGAGHTSKLLNNQMGAVIRAVSFEAAAIAAAQGIDWKAFLNLIRHSSGESYQFRKRIPRVLNRDFDPRFTIEHTRKDLRLSLQLADELNASTPVTNTVYELYKQADAKGFGNEDITALVKIFEETTGIPVESDEKFDEDFLDWKDI